MGDKQRVFSISLSKKKAYEERMIEAIKDAPSATTKEALGFWLKYRHLEYELDKSSDLLSLIAGMAQEQARTTEAMQALLERVGGLERLLESGVIKIDGAAQPETKNGWADSDQVELMEDF